MSRVGLDKGYHVLIVNPVAPANSRGRNDLELLDFTKNRPIKEAVQTVKEQFGNDVEIYALCFSLGSNHLLRHLGAHRCRPWRARPVAGFMLSRGAPRS